MISSPNLFDRYDTILQHCYTTEVTNHRIHRMVWWGLGSLSAYAINGDVHTFNHRGLQVIRDIKQIRKEAKSPPKHWSD